MVNISYFGIGSKKRGIPIKTWKLSSINPLLPQVFMIPFFQKYWEILKFCLYPNTSKKSGQYQWSNIYDFCCKNTHFVLPQTIHWSSRKMHAIIDPITPGPIQMIKHTVKNLQEMFARMHEDEAFVKLIT